jgi:ABC-2 type transport system permease protein
VQVPADIWLGQRRGTEVLWGLAFQAVWAVALLTVGRLVLGIAHRRIVVQGG